MHYLLAWLLRRLRHLLSGGPLPKKCLRLVLLLWSAIRRRTSGCPQPNNDHDTPRACTKSTKQRLHFEPLLPGADTQTLSMTSVCASRAPDSLAPGDYLTAEPAVGTSRLSSRSVTPEPGAHALLPLAHGPSDRGRALEGRLTEGYPGPHGSMTSVWASRLQSQSRPPSRFSARTSSPAPGNRSSAAVSTRSHMSHRSHLTHASLASHVLANFVPIGARHT